MRIKTEYCWCFPEHILADHGVRKYDYDLGRFTSTDALWEKYPGWSPYQYSLNNPINLLDWNGKWAKEVAQESHTGGYASKDSKGYIAQRINNEFFYNWKTNAPNIAKFVENNSLFVLQKPLYGTTYGEGEIGGNKSWFDLSKKSSYEKHEMNSFHEIVHNKGENVFGAWSAILAAGYVSKEEMIELINGEVSLAPRSKTGGVWYYLQGNEELRKMLFDGKITVEGVVDIMTKKGGEIIGKEQ
jgi:hypothetical protein